MSLNSADRITNDVKPRKESGIKYFRSWYNRQALLTKIVGWAVFAVLYLVIGLVYAPFQTSTVLISFAIVSAIAFSVIEIPYIMKTALAVIFSLIFIAFIPMGGSVFAPPEDQIFVIIFWFISHTLVLAFALLWLLYHPRGLVWINILVTAAIIGILSYGLYGSTQNLPLAVAVSSVCGILFVFLRTLVKSKKARNMELPSTSDPSRVIKDLNKAGFVPYNLENVTTKLVHDKNVLFAVNKYNQLVVIKLATVDEPITFNKKGMLFYKGQALSGWLAGQLLATKTILPRNIPFVFSVIVEGDQSINSRQVVPVSIRSRNHSVPQTILLVSAQNAGKYIRTTLEEYRPDPLSALELRKMQNLLKKLDK